MRAIRIHGFGGVEALELDELEMPRPAAGEALVRISAIGVNFIDIYQRSGQYRGALPLTLGQEAAGVVCELGAGVDPALLGARVAYAMQPGAYAEYAAVPAWKLVALPDAVSEQVAAAVMLQGMTAHYLSHSTWPLQPGDVALVHAAAGGVGQLLVQLARRRGARVIGTVSTGAKAAIAQRCGADVVVDYTREDFVAVVQRETHGRGVDVVYDSVGRTTFEQSLAALRPRGMLVLYGQSSGAVPPFDPQVLNARGSLFLTRPTLLHYSASRDELLGRAGALFAAIEAETLQVQIDSVYPLAEAGAAHAALAGRATSGKVLLVP
ncbi:MAG: quinone oxidoreductase [Chloroflexi bacterium]|nr:quinone oxidoreductase [Chloroflexota bacterium]